MLFKRFHSFCFDPHFLGKPNHDGGKLVQPINEFGPVEYLNLLPFSPPLSLFYPGGLLSVFPAKGPVSPTRQWCHKNEGRLFSDGVWDIDQSIGIVIGCLLSGSLTCSDFPNRSTDGDEGFERKLCDEEAVGTRLANTVA